MITITPNKCSIRAQKQRRPGGERELTVTPGLPTGLESARAQYYPAQGCRIRLSGGCLMAISKRLRYEILRRDNHTCRYCGSSSPQVKLTVDHVLPSALGGSDKPENLVAACSDCNAGKAASNPDQPLVAQASADASRWAIAVRASVEVLSREHDKMREYVDELDEYWNRWHFGFKKLPIPRPDEWESSIERFFTKGVPIAMLLDCARIALNRQRIAPEETWRYFMGVTWRQLDEIDDLARDVYTRMADG